MPLSRRDFLRSTAMIAGLGEVCAADTSPRTALPSWGLAACRRMKEEEKCGVAIRVPEALAERRSLGRALTRLTWTRDEEPRELFALAVWVCLPARTFDAIAPRATFALLEPTGRVRSQGRLALDSDLIVAAADGLFADSAALCDRAITLKNGATAAERAALDRLEAGDISLLARNGRLMPLIVWARRTTARPARAARLMEVIDAYFGKPGTGLDRRLPYGLLTGDGAGSCGSPDEEGPPRGVACGMACLPDYARHFVRFLKEPG